MNAEICPKCKTTIQLKNYNDGKCPSCGKEYSCVLVGVESAESDNGVQDIVSWK